MCHPVSLLVVRHCQSSGQASDAPLTAAGEAQARTLSAHLETFGVDVERSFEDLDYRAPGGESFRVRLAGGDATVERVWDPSAAAAP